MRYKFISQNIIMLTIYDLIIIFLICYLFYFLNNKRIKESMGNSTTCKNNIREIVKKIYKEDVEHVRNLTNISKMVQNKEGFKPKKGAIIEVKGDIEVGSGKIEVDGKNNYLENLIFDGDKVSIQHHSTGRRFIGSHDNNNYFFPNNGNLTFNTMVHPRYKKYHFTIAKP